MRENYRFHVSSENTDNTPFYKYCYTRISLHRGQHDSSKIGNEKGIFYSLTNCAARHLFNALYIYLPYQITRKYIGDKTTHLTEGLLSEIRDHSVADEINCRRHRFQNASRMFVTGNNSDCQYSRRSKYHSVCCIMMGS